MSKPKNDVVIIGAGPYGLSAAAHCQAVPGLQFKVFGEPMEFWQKNMPRGMFLRSSWDASHLADPGNKLRLESYVAARGNHLSNPIPIERFVDYGLWFQQQIVPRIDRRRISKVESAENGFEVTAEDGEVFRSRCVVVAAGISQFARLPEEFSALPVSHASHSSRHTAFHQFKGKRVLIVGAGQSALESGALLNESGASVKILARQPSIHWLRWRSRFTRSGLMGRLIYSPRDVGPPGISQLVARPDCLNLVPRNWRDWIDKRSIRPAGAAWLIKRVQDIPIRTNVRVISANLQNGSVQLRLNDGSEERADHLLLATGYRIDISKYKFLGSGMLSRLDVVNGYPKLRPGLESSIRGLYFLGAPAAWSFGPVARFVSGAYYCVPAMTKRLVSRL